MIFTIAAIVLIVAGLVAWSRARSSAPAVSAPPATEALPSPEPAAAPRDIAEIKAELAGQRRTAYIPVTTAGDAPGAVSKFSGSPYLLPGEEWPACGNCGQPMQLFVQLAGDDLPPEAHSRVAPGEVLQLFYCTSEDPHCEDDCDAWAPWSNSTVARIVPAAWDAPAGPPLPEGLFPPLRITGWTVMDDYPGFDDLEDMGVRLSDADADTLGDEFPRIGDKLLGWPAWVQGMEYPSCRVCGTRMELLFQLDSEDNLPYMFGDSGAGHVTQCPEHRTELAFGWACY